MFRTTFDQRLNATFIGFDQIEFRSANGNSWACSAFEVHNRNMHFNDNFQVLDQENVATYLR